MRGAVWGLALWAIGSAAAAGPWLREEGAVFLSFGQNLALSEGARLPVHLDPNAYAEWGAAERLTLALSLYSGDAGRETTAELRALTDLPLPEGWAGVATAYGGFGARRIDGLAEIDPLVLAGLSWGRGLPSGWLAIDAQVAFAPRTGTAERKIDLTFGHDWSGRWSGYLLLTAGTGHAGDLYAKLSPTAVLRLTDSTRITFGLTQALTGDRGTGLSLGTWLEF